MKKLTYLALTVAMAIPAAASAATTVYKGQDINPGPGASLATNPNASAASASFQSALSGTSTESFESFATGAPAPLNLSFTGSAGSLSAVLSGNGAVATATRAAPTASGQYATAGSNYYAVNSNNFLVTFGSSIAAFGFFATDLEDLADINITLNYTAGGSQIYTLQTLFGPPTGAFLESGSVHFLGFIDVANPFSSVSFAGVGANGDILAFDQMTIGDARQVVNPPGGVPEPATWAMMLLGIGLVGASMRRRQKVAVRYAF